MEKKKFKTSALTITFYVLAGLMLAYTVFQIVTTIKMMNQTFASYQTSFGEHIGEGLIYILNSTISPFINACILFGIGVAINEARKANPDNYVSVQAVDTAVVEAGQAVSCAVQEATDDANEQLNIEAAEETVEEVVEEENVADVAEHAEVVEEAAEETIEEDVAEVAEPVEVAEETAEETVEEVVAEVTEPVEDAAQVPAEEKPKKSSKKKAD